MAGMVRVVPGEAFAESGWRIPFLLSFVLIVVGIIVRRTIEESTHGDEEF